MGRLVRMILWGFRGGMMRVDEGNGSKEGEVGFIEEGRNFKDLLYYVYWKVFFGVL